jgi:hypothetical protein
MLCCRHARTVPLSWHDHPPPHVHVSYGDKEALVEIATGELIEGSLPASRRAKVRQWITLHRAELQAAWSSASAGRPLDSIDPLP